MTRMLGEIVAHSIEYWPALVGPPVHGMVLLRATFRAD
jgi:hypothetical protein